jgi:hypothetical protein
LAQNCSAYPYTLSNGTNADASQVMANFNQILNCMNNFSLGVSTGGTGQTSLNNHSLLIGQGTNPIANTGTGTTGQCLVSQGASADPIFVSGCRVLLATLTPINVATVSDTTHITSTYKDYEIVFENVLPATNSVTCEIQIHSGGAFKTTGYLGTAVDNGTSANVTTYIPCSGASTTTVPNNNGGVSGTFRIFAPSATAQPTLVTGQFVYLSTAVRIIQSGGAWNTAAATDGFQVLFSSGNISSGTIKIYGLL